MSLIDLSQMIAPGMPLFNRAAPQPVIHAWQSHEQSRTSGRYQGCTCEISEVQFVTSLGTYLDSPYHFDPEGLSIEDLKLEQLVLPGIVVDCRSIQSRQPIHPEVLEGLECKGKAVPASGFTFHAVPVKVKGAAAFPVRAYAMIGEPDL